MAINVGDKIPSATLRRKDENGISQIKTDDLFKGKKTVLFSVPGRFHPDLLGQASAGLRAEPRRAEEQGHRSGCLHGRQ